MILFGTVLRNKNYEIAVSSINAEALTNRNFFSSLFPTKSQQRMRFARLEIMTHGFDFTQSLGISTDLVTLLIRLTITAA